MAPPVLPLLLALTAVQQPRDSIVYVLSPASRFQVKTGKAGLLGFAGHSHVVSAHAFSGRIVYYLDTPADSHVEIVVPAESLEVLTPADTAEIRKVTEAMRNEVLHVADYHTITFGSKAVTPIDAGFRVQGELTLAGQTRDVTVDLQAEIGADTLRATGTFSVKQTDFGIKPYRGGPAGMVRVADRVTFTLEAVGIRLQGQ
ncbi:MAG: YceI family protein [Gemmatimonadales bacterium]